MVSLTLLYSPGHCRCRRKHPSPTTTPVIPPSNYYYYRNSSPLNNSATTLPLNPHDSSSESSFNGDNLYTLWIVSTSHHIIHTNPPTNLIELPPIKPPPNHTFRHIFQCRGRIKANKIDLESSFNGDNDRPLR